MQTKLILIEGQPFAGKSTLSEHVSQQLTLNGQEVEWLHEGAMWEQFPQTLEMLDQAQPISDDVLWSEWTAFVQTIEDRAAIFVVDAAVSYAAVCPLLWNDRPVADIERLVDRVSELCGPLQPRVIYMRGDQDRLARASIADRGPHWEKQMIDQSDAAPYQKARGRSGLEAAITFAEETQELLDVLLERTGWPTLTLDVTAADREANRLAALDFLGIREVEVTPIALAEDLQAYTGTYAEDDPEGTRGPTEVRLEQDGLVLYTSGQRLAPWIPVSATRIHLRANPIDVEFEVENGQAQRLVLLWADGRSRAHHRA